MRGPNKSANVKKIMPMRTPKLPQPARLTTKQPSAQAVPVHQTPPPKVEARSSRLQLDIKHFTDETARLSAGKDKRYEIIGAIHSRHRKALEQSFNTVSLRHSTPRGTYSHNLSIGLERFAREHAKCDIFKLLSNDEFILSEAHLTYSYYRGEALQGKSKFYPLSFEIVGKILADTGYNPDTLDLPSLDQNLMLLMPALDMILR
ncbi:MAG: hypothetical protein ABIA67_05945, partial [Candidatus Margulisiibacteriota bacterium]